MTEKPDSEKRQYKRLKTAFFIKFTPCSLQEGTPGIGWQQGYTFNVSEGGIGLETGGLKESTIKYLNKQDILLEVYIYIPSTQEPIKTVCEVAWFQHQEERDDGQQIYFIGLKFRSIVDEDRKKILSYTGWLKFMPNFLR